MIKLRHLFSILFLFLSSLGWAQLYPVQVNSTVLPPYLSTLSSYATTANQKYLVNIYTSDLNVVHRQVRLKLYIEGNGIQAQSVPVVLGANNLFINGGETLQLSNIDLAPYFQLENLTGINQNQYSGTLPQGNYKYCVEVYDFITNQRISQKSCTFYYFVYNEPPLLNTPTQHQVVTFQEPQNLFFTWTPRHINAVNIEYEFELVEILDQQVPSNHAFLTQIPLYKTTTPTTALLYGPTEPQLIAGRKYAWRVKALSQPGFGDKAVFNNDGYSEIFDFVYPGNCQPPKFVLAVSLNATQTKITWQSDPSYLDYKIEYRKKGSTTWYPTAYYNNEAKIYDLEAGATYEYRVGGECIGGLVNYTPVDEFTQPTKDAIAIKCGMKPNVDLSNVALFQGELPNDQVIMAGDFAIKLTEVRGKGAYTGKGYVSVPYLSFVKIGVEFKDISINTDFKLVKGDIKALYDPSWKNIIDVGKIYDQIENVFDYFSPDIEEHQFETNFEIPDLSHISVSSNAIVVTGADGQTQSFDHDPGELVVIRDPKGNVYAIPQEGDKPVVLNEGEAAGFIPNAENTQGVSSSGTVTSLAAIAARVTFERAKESKYADDQMPTKAHPAIQKLYKTIPDGATSYNLYHKGVQNDGKGSRSFDYVDAVIEVKGSGIKPEEIQFNIKGSTAKKIGAIVMKSGKAYQTLEVPVYDSSAPVELMALLPGKDGAKNQVLGVAKIIPIKILPEVNLTLIPVNDAVLPTGLQDQLNGIYKDAAVQFKVTVAANYTVAKTEMECGKDALLDKLSEDQATFVETYQKTHPADKNQYYIFVTSGITPSRPISGFMPRHSQCGFVFGAQKGDDAKAASNITDIIAHELGHGVFELQHPWEEFNTGSKNSNTPWLMDYTSGTKLAYVHWQRISHPKFGVYALDSSEQGELAGGYAIAPDLTFVKSQLNTVISSSRYTAPLATLGGFEDKFNNREVNYFWDEAKGKYIAKVDGKEIEYSIKIKPTNDKDVIWLFYDNELNCNERKYIKTTYELIKNKINSLQALQAYVGTIKGKAEFKKKEDDDRNVYWGVLPCNSDSNSGSETGSGYANYINNLGKKANQTYSPDNKPVNTSENHLFDYTKVISDAEKQKVFSELQTINTSSKLVCKIYLTDTKTPEQKKTEIATYVNDLPGKQIALWIDFDAQGKASIKTFLGKEIKGRDAEETGIYIKYLSDVLATLDLPELKFNPLTALLDGIAGLIEEAKIPERFYNPDHAQYNPLPSMVYSITSLSIINDEMDKFINSGNTDVVKYSQSRQQFALLCGVWNGFVELVAGVPQGLSLVVKADEGLMNLITNKDNARAKLKEAFDKFSWSALGNMIDQEWKKATANPCMVSHLSGKVVFVVASCFIGAGEANIASKFLQTVERLDVIGQAMGKFAKLSSPIVKAAFNKAGKLVILPLAKLEPQISIRLRTLFKENVRQLLNRTSDQVALSLHALDNGNFLWDNIEVSPEELAEILAKKLDPNKKEIVLLSCNDLASAQALAQATGKKVYTTNGAITIFENGIKRADNTKWYEVSSDGTATELSSPPVKECSTCTGEGVEMGVSGAENTAEALKARELLSKLKLIEHQVTDDLVGLANKNGGKMEGLDFRLKSEESLIRKLQLDGINTPMNDVLRYTTTFDDATFVKGIENTLNDLKDKGYEVVKLKNTFVDGSMYKGININMKNPNGQIFELQFHTPNSFNMKQNINHTLYEEYRLLDENSTRAIELKNLMINNSNSVINPINVQTIK
ncbi:fibronectin type III domain-containing protein [Flavobacterium davisii]|uniref:fibronectin type III domain-containing protein n=1 Tax=Flavobacterium davisii TaxID=2906077 RepID=UPI000F505E2A|nr:fibronectin type III domain-containing protein [Flavobacterium davisii]